MYWENVNLSDEQSIIIRCNYVCCFQLVGWWSAVLYLLNSNLLNLVFTTYISERLFAWRNEATLVSEKELMLLMMVQKHFYNNLKVKQQLTWAHWVYWDTEPSLKCTKLSYKQDLLPPRASKSQAVQCSWDHHWDNTKQQDSENHKEAVRRFFDQNTTFWFIRQSLELQKTVHCSIRTLSML